MNILGYGEDSLTLWVLKNRIQELLDIVNDRSNPDECLALYRPSFGRRGGAKSSQFGEFDFILATPQSVYLGESKWLKSESYCKKKITLQEEQHLRHKIFSVYYKVWITKKRWEWEDFLKACSIEFNKKGITKPTPPISSLLSKNLKTVLENITEVTKYSNKIKNILLLIKIYENRVYRKLQPPENFRVVEISVNNEINKEYFFLM